MVAAIDGVSQGEPLPIAVPPEDAVYQLILPNEAVAAKLTVVFAPQLLAGVFDETVGNAVTVIVIGLV